MSRIMHRSSRRRVLAAAGTLIATACTGKWTAQALAAAPDADLPAHPPAPLPAFGWIDADGHRRTLADYRGQGVLLNLWATWCVPCVTEMPALDRLAKALSGSGVSVLAVSVDRRGIDAVRPWFAAHGIETLPPLADPHSTILSALGLAGIPTSLVIDREGREVARVDGKRAWDAPDMVAAVRRLALEWA